MAKKQNNNKIEITERKVLETGLEKTRKELEIIKKTADDAGKFAESVINTVREPLIALDQDLRVVKVNRSFYEVFNVIPQDTVGQFIYDLGNKQWDIPKLRELLETILPQKTTFDNYEVEHDFATIGRRIMLLNARQIQQTMGKERIILLAIDDITERKKAEDKIKKTQRHLEELTHELLLSNKELEAFSYSVSHDLRAPLRSMDGFSQALLKEYFNKLDDKGKDYLNRIRNSTQLMGRLIEALLSLSKVSRYEINFQKIDLTNMVNSIIFEIKKNDPERKVDIIINKVPEVESDMNMLSIALTNLINNAWKFTKKKSVPKIEFGFTKNKDEIVYFIKDNGAGFNMIYADKLFGAFQRLHTQKEFPGTGIGLAIVKRIFNRLGGRIWVEAEEGKGAAFYFLLPNKDIK